MSSIAIVGMACIYPDARSPVELWENVLAQRQAFRQMPPERLRAEDYLSRDKNATDLTYSAQAALIEGYEFDRERFRVVGSTYRSTDLAHWLALDVAAQALADAGFAEGAGTPKDSTGVLVGNTLTGEFSRASVMRLRWPYVRRVVNARLAEEGWEPEKRAAFLNELEVRYKEPFPQVGDETLAGGLSNTIAGRICNYFDFGGGGYTVDGACSSSLLAVTNACSALTAGDIDVALAGGVDLSLDPFELVGFSRVGALAEDEMRVYDARPTGFLPGEGCGFVVLMRHQDAIKHQDAVKQNLRIYAVIKGWGVSSDGSGGLTRPGVAGQRLAIGRAYQRAGYRVDAVSYFEGHGTGTTIGDEVELRTLSSAIKESNLNSRPVVIGSIKANIGHTKAAAGIAGLIKATMAVHTQIIPPNTGFEKPHPELSGDKPALRLLSEGWCWDPDRPIRAGVSSMGFGGINVHVTIEGTPVERRRSISARERTVISSAQDAELLLLGATDTAHMRRQVTRLREIAPGLSRAEVGDLASRLSSMLYGRQVRAAIVASNPTELVERLDILEKWLEKKVDSKVDVESGLFLGSGTSEPRIGFLFSGQASPARLDGGAMRRRFESVRELYDRANLPTDSDGIETSIAQPAIVTASMAALRVLNALGVTAAKTVGHSLGELTAFHWAGAFDEKVLLRIATARGRVMTEFSRGHGAMASIGADKATVERLLDDGRVVIAGLNLPQQTVVSGEKESVTRVMARAQQHGVRATTLPVSHAFHSPLMEPVEPPFAEFLATEEFRRPCSGVVSTITGAPLYPNEDLKKLLCRQLTHPVRFADAIQEAARDVDLWLEVGPGQVLSAIAGELVDNPVIPIDAGGPSFKGLLKAVGAAYALGMKVNHKALFADRFIRPFDLDRQSRFFVNPCELAPPLDSDALKLQVLAESSAAQSVTGQSELSGVTPSAPDAKDALSLVKQLVADKTELPMGAIADNSRFLDDLHLNSLAVSQIAAQAAKRLNLPPLTSPNQFADATVAQMAKALESLKETSGPSVGRTDRLHATGVDSWIRSFTVELVEKPLPHVLAPSHKGTWKVMAPPEHRLAGLIKKKLDEWGGGGYVVCLPPKPNEDQIGLLLEAARAVLDEQEPTRLVFVQHGGGAASFARTLHLEAHGLTTCVVDVPDTPDSVEWIIAEVKAAVGYTEAHYDLSGNRRVPVLKLLAAGGASKEQRDKPSVGPSDVLLVTGGGKGIAAECAAALAQDTGVRLALMGRSQPRDEPELAANLERMRAKGIRFLYVSADVTDPGAVKKAVAEAEKSLGPITGFLHGAGINEPKLLRSLDETAFRKTVAPKVDGARNVLAALDSNRLKLFVTFGSIIARTGMPGEADYAVANEWLTRLTEKFQTEHPNCQCLAIEWSVWSGVGMGERLGRIEMLVQQGITPISPDEGIAVFRRLLSLKQPPAAAVVVTGRFGEPPTLQVDKPELPLLRFVESPRVFYPGIELVVDAKLAVETDPYLEDHVFRGERLFPAVMGLEAMAQAAMALVGTSQTPIFEEVRFERPVVVPAKGAAEIRVAALVRESDVVEVVLRCEETAFQADHFRARCRFTKGETLEDGRRIIVDSTVPSVPLAPRQDLYGGILFHQGRFRRLEGYRRLKATECLAEISPDEAADWFGRYLPQSLVLGDPAVRDATIHAIQACVPNASLLPIGCDRLIPMTTFPGGPIFVKAVERLRDKDIFVYDVEVGDVNGRICERWEGLKLQMISGTARLDDWVAPLLGPYLERKTNEFVSGARVSVVVDQNRNEQRRTASELAVQRALGEAVSVRRRPDGKPEVDGDWNVSVSHAGNITIAVAGLGPVGCDVEPVVKRPDAAWLDLLGQERFTLAKLIARQTGEDISSTATRVWTVSECLKKAGGGVQAPMVLGPSIGDGWVRLVSGRLTAATCATTVRGVDSPLVFAVLAMDGNESV